jgi:hypothetical protein
VKRFAIMIAVLLGACSDRSQPVVAKETDRPRRVVEPTPRQVRALPPHAIRADGVGPYKLGASSAEVLEQLPSGPRIRQMPIPGVVLNVLRGEDDAILIGTEPQGKAQFVAVVSGEIARTEAGIQVGSTRAELEKSLGAPLDEPDRARDPRIVIPSKLDNAHVVLENDRIAAIVLTPAVERSKDAAGSVEHPCTRPAGDRDKKLFGVCLSLAGELVRVGDDDLTVLAKDNPEKILAPATRVPGLVFAAALRNPFDGRDDLVAISRVADSQARTWWLTTFRMLDGKLLRVNEPSTLYQITSANARWIGAELENVDLMVELVSKGDAIEVGGLLTTRINDKIRDIVVISPIPVPRRRTKPASTDAPDAGLSDGGVPESERPRR